MFRGISKASLDDRGRFAVPVRLRDALRSSSAGKLVITVAGQDKCLLLYPEGEWDAVAERLAEAANESPTGRHLERMLVGFATDVDLDGNGRVLIPPLLREEAEIDRTVMVMGQTNKLELWNEYCLKSAMAQWRSQGKEAFENLERREDQAGTQALARLRL